jgi:hypothetical protein
MKKQARKLNEELQVPNIKAKELEEQISENLAKIMGKK